MNESTPIYFADLESTGLLHNLVEQGDKAKLHNFCAMNSESEKIFLFHNDTFDDRNKLKRFLDREIILVMHNGICYDKNALKHFGYDVSKIHFVDTLGLSWYLDLNRPKHGLEGYGEEAGVPKPEIKDWESLTQEDYDYRVVEDVKIQQYTYKKLKSMFEELYGEMTDYQFCTHKVVKYINFKMQQLEEQQNIRIKIDVPKAEKLVEDLTEELDRRIAELTAVMPKVPVIAKHTMPKKPFKKDGSLSATGEKWKALTEEAGVDFEYRGTLETIKSYKEPNPQSSQQIKDWLFSYGWQPKTFKYVREDDGSDRKIPQIYIQGSGGQICDSIEDLAKKIPEVENLTGVGVLKHRIGVVKGFIDSLVFGESVEAGASGFTNTLRLKHRKPIVNLPSNRVAYGADVRSCMIAREGKILCGSDLSSLENNIKFNFQLEFDRKGVESQLADDYDPHLEIAQEGGLLRDYEVHFYKIADKGFPRESYPYSNELADLLMLPEEGKKKEIARISDVRSKGKATNYACVPMDTEVLTTSGFKKFEELKVGEKILSYKNGNLVEDSISHLHFYEDAEVVHYGDSNKTLRCTRNHRWLVSGRDESKLVYKELQDFNTETKIRTTAPYVGGGKLSRVEGEFFGWLLSDGHIRKESCSIAQSKNKFCKELEDVLSKNGLGFSVFESKRENGNHVNIYTIPQEQTKDIFNRCGVPHWDRDFDWSKWVITLSREALEGFVDAFYLGDGYVMDKRSYAIAQNRGSVFDAVQLAVYLIGDGRVTSKFRKKEVDYGLIRKHKTNNISCQRKKVRKVTFEDVFCLTTGNSNFVIKQDGEIMITGNCQYGAGASTVARTAGVSQAIGKRLVEAYRSVNWANEKIANQHEDKYTSFGRFQKNKFNGMWYHLKNDKDKLSTGIQGSGSYILDLWLANMFLLRDTDKYKERLPHAHLLATIHDECILELPKGCEGVVEELLLESLDRVNKTLKVDIPFGCDVQFGSDYSQIH